MWFRAPPEEHAGHRERRSEGLESVRKMPGYMSSATCDENLVKAAYL